jgi:predicted nucleotide-binding protein (sugar kinase/HSP70/actin superfamily)
MVNQIIQEFDKLPLRNIQKPRIAVVGQILVRFHSNANNDIVGIIEKKGTKTVVPNFLNFFFYSVSDKNYIIVI